MKLNQYYKENNISPISTSAKIKLLPKEQEELNTKRVEKLVKTLEIDIVEKYESGKYASKRVKIFTTVKNICQHYNEIDGIVNKYITENQILEVLRREYNVSDNTEIPKVLNESKSNTFISQVLGKSEPQSEEERENNREKVVQYARNVNIIIPKEILDNHPLIGKYLDSTDVKRIQKVYGDSYNEYVELLNQQINLLIRLQFYFII